MFINVSTKINRYQVESKHLPSNNTCNQSFFTPRAKKMLYGLAQGQLTQAFFGVIFTLRALGLVMYGNFLNNTQPQCVLSL